MQLGRDDFPSDARTILVKPAFATMREDTQIGGLDRRAVLDALMQIVEASSLEELFSGPDTEALLLYDVLEETAKGRAASCYWEVCRTARRRRVTPEYVSDRAVVLLASIHERRKWDLYRVLGVPPLSSFDMIRHRYLELAKVEHPDMGGDAGRFRSYKEAYEILKDDDRRAEYERFWVRALGPFERIAPADERMAYEAVGPVVSRPAPPPVADEPSDVPVHDDVPADEVAAAAFLADTVTAPSIVTEITTDAAVDHTPAPVEAPAQVPAAFADVSDGLQRIAGLLREWDARVFPNAPDGPPGRVVHLAAGLRSVVADASADVERRQAEVDQMLDRMTRLRAHLDQIADLKQRVR